MLTTRRLIDFRGKQGADYFAVVRELAAAIRGDKPARPSRGEPIVSP